MSYIQIPTPLRKFTQNQASFETNAQTVGQSLHELVTQYPDLGKHLHDAAQKLKPFIRVYLGEEDIQYLQAEATPVPENAVISIIPAIAGG